MSDIKTPLASRAREAGSRAFGSDWTPNRVSIAPGRLELIGNHVDYNGGRVIAAAIDRVLLGLIGDLDVDGGLRVVLPDVDEDVDRLDLGELHGWRASEADSGSAVYIRGVIASLLERDIGVRGNVAMSIVGDIPAGFGMSSSAALCVAVINALSTVELAPLDIVSIAREAEHRAGSPVGAMDQSASVGGNVILFDGATNTFRAMQPDLGDHVFAVAGSGVDRSLRTSSYGDRVKESEAARATLEDAIGLDLPTLADVAPHWNVIEERARQDLDDLLFRRARHVATECLRVDRAVTALDRSDWQTFGQLMNASGESSAHDYEISHPDVEALVGILRGQPGVLGARMMGGGEGGPALALLDRQAVGAVRAALEEGFYRERAIDVSTAFEVCRFGPGAQIEPFRPATGV